MAHKVLPCGFSIDEDKSRERGTATHPFVFRCVRCGFITKPCRNSDPTRIRRQCFWFDPKLPGFAIGDPCWCRGLGDVIHRGIDLAAKWIPGGRYVRDFVTRKIVDFEAHLGRQYDLKFPAKCGGCEQRRVSLNEKYPLVWLRKRICPPIVKIEESKGDRIPICLSFGHGFGDAVQFTAVLKHLRKYRPQWDLNVYCKAGAHSLFNGLAQRVGVCDRDDMGKIYQEDVASVYGVRWFEPDQTYGDSPATKVERCLREEFGITPDPELWDYSIQVGDAALIQASRALGRIAKRGDDGRFKVVAIHYQGNSWRSAKNMSETIARKVVKTVIEAGFVPLILDWEDPFRSMILQEKTRGVYCFDKHHELWGPLERGDGEKIAALLSQVRLVVGIDSGPEHAAASTGTRTIVVWNKSHPINYFSPKHSVLHVVRGDHGKYIAGDRETGERFFREHYNYVEATANLRVFLPDLVRRELSNAIDRAGGILDSGAVRGTGSSNRS